MRTDQTRPSGFSKEKRLKELFAIAKEINKKYSKLGQYAGSILGGSTARGYIDHKSDIEMEIFYKGDLPSKKQILNIITQLHGKLSRSKNVHWFHPAWGYHSFFIVDNVKIELGYREIDETLQRMKKFCTEFTLPIHGTHDTPFGYYESGLASYLDESVILDDRTKKINTIKTMIHIFPENIRRTTIDYYFKDAKIFTFVKLKQAVERNDLFQFNSCSARIIRSLNICLFAINKTYFPGDKWNEHYINRFKIKPADYNESMRTVCSISDYGFGNKKIKYELTKNLVLEFETLIKNENARIRKK